MIRNLGPPTENRTGLRKWPTENFAGKPGNPASEVRKFDPTENITPAAQPAVARVGG